MIFRIIRYYILFILNYLHTRISKLEKGNITKRGDLGCKFPVVFFVLISLIEIARNYGGGCLSKKTFPE